jgi:Protein of unknown function (DUF2568)
MRAANDGLAFLLELAALAALGSWGFTLGPNLSVRIALGLGAPALMIVVWGWWLAPRSEHRLQLPWLILAKIGVFGLAVVALAVTGHPWLAAALAALTTVNLTLAAAWERA